MAVDRKVFGGIRNKILFWFLIILIPLTLGMVSVGYWYGKGLKEEQIECFLNRTVEMVRKEVYSFIEAKKSRVIDFSSDGFIRDALLEINLTRPDNKDVVEKLNHHLAVNKVPLDSDIMSIMVIDLHGRCVASSQGIWLGKDFSKKDYFIEGLRQGIFVTDLYLCEDLDVHDITMSGILTDRKSGASIGVLAICFRGSALSNITRSWDVTKGKDTPRFHGMGRTGEVFIVNEDHRMITESRFVEDAILRQIVYTEPVRGAFSTGKETTGIYLDYRGVEVFGSARLIDASSSGRWVTVAKKDLAEVIEPIKGLRNIGIGLCIVGAGIVAIVAFFIARSITKPVHKLVTAMEKVAEGDLDYRISLISKDEIGYLSNSFNEMTSSLKRSRDEHRTLFNEGIDAMFVIGEGEKITDVNEGACDLLGRERNAILGTNISEFIGYSNNIVKEAIGKTWTLEIGGEHPTLTVSLTCKKSEEVLCELDLKRIENGIYAVFRDITERKRLEQEISDEKQRLDDIVTEMGAGLSLVDRDMKVVWMNKTLSTWFGEQKDLEGSLCYSAYWDNKEVCHECPARETFVTGTVQKSIHTHTTPDGKRKWYTVTTSPIKDSKGYVTHVLELIQDITEEKQAEEEFKRLHDSVVQANTRLELYINKLKSTQQQLIQSEKMASVGQLAAGVAHEINNPLSYISSNINILNSYVERMEKFLKKCDEGKPIFEKGDFTQIMTFFREVQDLRKEIELDFVLQDFRAIVNDSCGGVEQIKRIISNLTTFSRVDEELPRNVNLNRIIDGILTVVWGELKYKAEIIKEYGDIPDIKCYPQQLGQVFMNLLTNAAHSIEGNGKITIKTYKAGNNIYVEVKDTGKGMPEEIQSKIFEPFFTTKEPGKGTGLGLTVAYNIVQKHFGRIEVSSKVGEGTTFAVVIPIRG
ncbi:MAG TPA: ATP-binding protein [Candidatus Brocadiia bacterium]|nr:PAS domain S-box protein [Candidatus Brocadiales bacterium]